MSKVLWQGLDYGLSKQSAWLQQYVVCCSQADCFSKFFYLFKMQVWFV